MKRDDKNPGAADTDTRGLLPAGSTCPSLLVLGSFPSIRSLATKEYYGNPRNQFWEIIGTILGIPPSLPYEERLSLLASRGILLWDLLSSCTRQTSSDTRIKDPIPNDIRGLVRATPSIRCIALNGTTGAGKYFRLFFPDILKDQSLRVMILPSTSSANARSSFLKKADAWREILKYLPD